MVLEGTYTIEKDENTIEFFKSSGMPEDWAKSFIKRFTFITIASAGDEYSITMAEEKDNPLETKKYVIGQEIEEGRGSDHTMKTTFMVEGGKLVWNSVHPDGKKLRRAMEATSNGILHTFENDVSPVPCKRYMVKI